MSENLKIGQIITDEQYRDAIHIAVMPVIANESLKPGQRIGLSVVKSNDKEPLVSGSANMIGIVDPFLTKNVSKGQKFWMFLNPGSITSLRHEWTHPDVEPEFFPDASKNPTPAMQMAHIARSTAWLKDFAERINRDYNRVLDIALKALTEGSAFVGDDDTQSHFDNEKEAFLSNAAVVLGVEYDPEEDHVYFSCAC